MDLQEAYDKLIETHPVTVDGNVPDKAARRKVSPEHQQSLYNRWLKHTSADGCQKRSGSAHGSTNRAPDCQRMEAPVLPCYALALRHLAFNVSLFGKPLLGKCLSFHGQDKDI
ncbi:hypothetical protein AAFF_G00057440 [Aldrovandia affinis]|uniref:Uncharacterized protein n=1 Tax=Aldrovandia affinis TaxID=143900 RepID=A0AAD7R1N7_9TELE|nr:hypothetical protein AAFF_G00057440 [Aldrovandia affinis]